jgi:hypothetical protein
MRLQLHSNICLLVIFKKGGAPQNSSKLHKTGRCGDYSEGVETNFEALRPNKRLTKREGRSARYAPRLSGTAEGPAGSVINRPRLRGRIRSLPSSVPVRTADSVRPAIGPGRSCGNAGCRTGNRANLSAVPASPDCRLDNASLSSAAFAPNFRHFPRPVFHSLCRAVAFRRVGLGG